MPMNNLEWNSCKNALAMLNALRESDEQKFDSFTKELQLFYIDCCRAYIGLLPQEYFKIALDTAKSYINGEVSDEQVSHQNWYTESAVFGMVYDEPPFEYRAIYENIAQHLELNFDEARDYAIKLGYFIDWASLYAQSFNGRIPKQYEEFLIPEMLRKYIPKPF